MNWNLAEALEYYKKQGAPGDQNALVNLLREAQQAHGGNIPAFLLPQMGEALGIKESYLQAIIRRIPSLRLDGTHCLELCGGPNCSKRATLAAFVEKNWGKNPKDFHVKYVPCMRLCGKGPNIRWDGKVYHGADEALLRKLIQEAERNG